MKKIFLLILLTCCIWESYAAKVDTMAVLSKSMHKLIKNVVILPDLYKEKGEAYSVVYLLHGAYGNHKDWVTKGSEVLELADRNNLIIVCPDGGFNSWYFDSPVDSTMRYETYISKELIEHVDKNYNTIKKRTNRAITGLSMGGHGALYLAIKHPEIWGAAGSMSGGVDLRPFAKEWDILKRLGEYSSNHDNWEKNTVINMLYLLKNRELQLIFDCGVDDFFFSVNNDLHTKMLANKIPHEYIVRPGKHNWNYWQNSIKYHMLYFYEYFKKKH